MFEVYSNISNACLKIQSIACESVLPFFFEFNENLIYLVHH